MHEHILCKPAPANLLRKTKSQSFEVPGVIFVPAVYIDFRHEPDFASCVGSEVEKCGNLRATEVVSRVGLNLWFAGWYPSWRIREVYNV